jgi:hypothetical protein
MYTEDEALTPRLANAFVGLTKLCGAKEEAY